MNKVIYFGEKIKGFDMRVLNEREVRAGAGVLFIFAIISFLNAWLTGNFYPTKLFIVVFLVDFFIRIFINPKYAPSLIVGRFMVNNQTPEYVGAAQKRFAWIIGFMLALIMFVIAIANNITGPMNLVICLLCLALLFFETAFGICLGCKMYNKFNKKKAKLCPGGSCVIKKKVSIQRISIWQIIIVGAFLAGAIFINYTNLMKKSEERELFMKVDGSFNQEYLTVPSGACVIPDWVKKIGHEKKYRQHHGCN